MKFGVCVVARREAAAHLQVEATFLEQGKWVSLLIREATLYTARTRQIEEQHAAVVEAANYTGLCAWSM
jgi:hypothetical protein